MTVGPGQCQRQDLGIRDQRQDQFLKKGKLFILVSRSLLIQYILVSLFRCSRSHLALYTCCVLWDIKANENMVQFVPFVVGNIAVQFVLIRPQSWSNTGLAHGEQYRPRTR